MAKLRSVDTHFWQDEYIVELDPIEKLLFLYFLTNPAAGMSGCYERPLRIIAFDTGIDKDMLIRIISRFEGDQKIMYREGWVVLFNFNKHNNLNPSMQRAAEKELFNAPGWIHNILSSRLQQDDNRMITACKQDEGNRIELNRIESEGKAEIAHNTPLSIFRQYFPDFIPSVFQQDLIESSVDPSKDLLYSRWKRAVMFWAGNGYQPRSVDKLINCYESGAYAKEYTNGNSVPTVAAVINDGCGICEAIKNGVEGSCPYHGGKQ